MISRRNKRSALSENRDANTLNGKNSKKTKKTKKSDNDNSIIIPSNIFMKLVTEAGVAFSLEGNKINTDPITFWQKLNKSLETRNENIKETVEIFIKAFEDTIDDEKFFVCCLMPTELSVALDELGLTSSQVLNSIQDSVMKLLMQCKHLQSYVIKALVKKLPLYAENESVQVDPCFGISDTAGADIINMPRLILNQLRWLDVVVDSTEIATELLEMASIMQSEVACDIVSFVPDLMPDDCDHEAIASSLCDLLSSGLEHITSAVFDALSNLCLSEQVKKTVYDLAVTYLTSASVQDIPVIVKYLLRSCESIEVSKRVISLLRPHLDFSVLLSDMNDDNKESLKSATELIANIMSSCMQFRSHIGAGWLNVLEKISSSEINVGDVIALFLLCDVNNSTQRKNALHLLHTKLKRGLLPHDVLKKTTKICSHIISVQFKFISQVTQGLLWQADPALKNASALLYEEFLLNLDSLCQQETVGLLVGHVSSMTNGRNSETDLALGVLSKIAQTTPSVLVSYANFLRDALDHMELMSLERVRKSYHVLSSLAYSANDTLTLSMRDGVHMTLQKQLTNTSDRYRHIGIIGSITILIAMSKTVEQKEVTEKVGSLFEMLSYVLRNDVRGWALFFDEVFIALQSKSDFPEFLAKKLNDEAQSKLQEKFLTDYDGSEAPSTSYEIDCCYRYGLLSAEEQKETELGIKLTPLLFNSQNRYVTTMLCSVFRSISSLERRLTGALGEIDALLCCPILLQDVVYESKAKFAEMSVQNQLLIFDSLFATLNWFRELISVFSTETDPEVELNVLVRLKQISDLQAVIDVLLTIAPEHFSPILVNSSTLDMTKQKQLGAMKSVSKPPTTSVKPTTSTQKDGKPHNTSIASTSGPVKANKSKKEKKAPATEKITLLSPKYRSFLRELNLEVFVLLKHPLQCQQMSHEKLKTEGTSDHKHLRPRHLLLLLSDLNEKLKHRLSLSKLPAGFGHLASAGVGFEQIDQVSAVKVVETSVKLLPHLCRHLEDINTYFQEEQSRANSADLDDSLSSVDVGLSLRQHEKLTACYEYLVEILYYILSWHGLDDESNKNLLDSLMKVLSRKLSASSNPSSASTLLSNSFRYVQNLSATIPTSPAAHTLVKLLITLYDFADENKSQQDWMSKKISSTAIEFLRKEWPDMAAIASSQTRNTILNGLFRSHLKHSGDVLESIEEFLKTSLSYLLDDPIEREESDSISYPCLTKSNFYLFYKTMIEVLGAEASSIPPPSKAVSSDVDNVDLLLRWSEAVKVLDMLIRVLKTFSSRVMLGPALKYARATVESFVRTGIPVCEVTFREHQDDVINLLKKVQISTRQLQHAACHSKVAKDSSLTNHVPALKRCLETFVFRVKAMLVLHNCQDAFWLGNLKNRNLQGEELLSQMPSSPSSSAEEDLDTTDEPSNNAEESGEPRSYSESY